MSSNNHAKPGEGILTWLWQEIREGREQNDVLVRVELSPQQWNTLRREFNDRFAVDHYGPAGKPKVFGLPVRVVRGKRAPEVVRAHG